MQVSEFQDAISAASDVEFRVEAADRRSFNASMKSHRVGPLSLSEVECDPAIIERPGQGRDGSRVFVVMQLEGTGTIRYLGRQFDVVPGDFFIADSAHSYQNIFDARVRRMVVRMEREQLLSRIPAASGLYGNRVSGESATARLFCGLLRAVSCELPQIDPHTRGLLGTRLIDMFALAVPAGAALPAPMAGDARDSARRIALRQRILDHIDLHLGEADLDTRKIAAALRLSPRYVQDLFAGADMTVRDHIRNRRLQQCHALLSDRTQDHLTVSQIAFDAGFNSFEHFCRCFRSRYGLSPGSLRRRVN